MNTMKFPKSVVLEKLKVNRKGQEAAQKTAMDGWAKELQTALEKALADMKAGKLPQDTSSILNDLERPQDVLNSYDVAISMLENTSDETVVMSVTDYQRYFLDRWEWKESWTGSNLKYSNR